MAAHKFTELAKHIGHDIECIDHEEQGCVNVSVECVNCCVVLFDLDEEGEHYEKVNGE